jgi:hypothetical protein
MAIPPLVAVLSKAGHHLHVIPGAIEVLMASAGPHTVSTEGADRQRRVDHF